VIIYQVYSVENTLISPFVFPTCDALKELLKSINKIFGIYLDMRGEKDNFRKNLNFIYKAKIITDFG
jgi:hypothetical protein